MNEINHTPGPWEVMPFANESAYITAKSWTGLALVYGNYHNPEAATEGRANAALIASAPELYDALVAIVTADDAQELTSEEIDAARAAIAKAQGAA